MHLKISSGKWRPSCLGLNVLMHCSASGCLTKCSVSSCLSFCDVSSFFQCLILVVFLIITRVAPWGPDRRKWLFSEVRGGIWTPHSPVLIKISADKRQLNQLTVKIFFFHYSSKHFSFNTIIMFMKKQLIWVFEWRKSVHYWWSYILFSPECKELTGMLDPLLYRWSVPPVVIRCVHWTMQMEVLQTWIKAQGLAIVMLFLLM